MPFFDAFLLNVFAPESPRDFLVLSRAALRGDRCGEREAILDVDPCRERMDILDAGLEVLILDAGRELLEVLSKTLLGDLYGDTRTELVGDL